MGCLPALGSSIKMRMIAVSLIGEQQKHKNGNYKT